jgi:hypothetical protein
MCEPKQEFSRRRGIPTMSTDPVNKECANCGTTKRALNARQMCGLCHYAWKKLEQADQDKAHGFERGYKKECQRRLDILRIDEQKRRGPISGLDVEHKLISIARRAGVRKNKLSLFRGLATLINEEFKPEQKSLMYGLLSDIEEHVPWAGIDWHRVVSGSRQD